MFSALGVAQEGTDGTLEYVHLDSGAVALDLPSSAPHGADALVALSEEGADSALLGDTGHPHHPHHPKKPAKPGYAIRVGEWKGVVPHCADQVGLRPSAADEGRMMVFHLPSDPFETTDVAASAQGQAAAKAFLKLLLASDFSCTCYQC